MNRFLLDTNILLGLTRKAKWAKWAYDHYEMARQDCVVFTSVICKGELIALAEKRGWAAERRTTLENVLNEFPVAELNRPEILHAYAQIDAWTHGTMPQDASDLPPVPKPAVPMKQNDLWIAASARATKSKLLSTDRDFDHLKDGWLNVDWIDQAKALD